MHNPEQLLLTVLNSTPVVDGTATDQMTGSDAEQLLLSLGGTGQDQERKVVISVRDALQGIVRGNRDGLAVIASALGPVTRKPIVSEGGISWDLQAPSHLELASRVVLAWSDVTQQLPGRLRPCGNDECQLFLVDHSRPGTAKWCSMATCGNRMKARAHLQRQRS